MPQNLRINYSKVEPDAVKPLYSMAAYLRKSGVEQTLRDLIYIRASQINGCAFCLDMHTQDARANGETEQRINCVSAWKESPFFTDRERAALEMTEALTLLPQMHFPEELYNKARLEFDEHEFVAVVMAINVINGWNRLVISCGGTAGMYSNQALKERNPEYFSGTE